MEEEGLLERSATVGADLLARLRDALGDHPLVGDVRGRGLLIGIELVADQATRAPAERAVSAGIVAAAQQRGLLLGRNVDTAAGLDNVDRARAAALPHRRGRRPHRRRARRGVRRPFEQGGGVQWLTRSSPAAPS